MRALGRELRAHCGACGRRGGWAVMQWRLLRRALGLPADQPLSRLSIAHAAHASPPLSTISREAFVVGGRASREKKVCDDRLRRLVRVCGTLTAL